MFNVLRRWLGVCVSTICGGANHNINAQFNKILAFSAISLNLYLLSVCHAYKDD